MKRRNRLDLGQLPDPGKDTGVQTQAGISGLGPECRVCPGHQLTPSTPEKEMRALCSLPGTQPSSRKEESSAMIRRERQGAVSPQTVSSL